MSPNSESAVAFPHPAYRVLTQRLHLRCWEPSDAEELRALTVKNQAHLEPWMVWMANEPETLQQKIDRLRRSRAEFDLGQNFAYGLFENDGALLGSIALIPRVGAGGIEIGYWIDAEHTGRGFATEASAALTRVAFEVLNVDRIQIHCHPDNAASMRIPHKLGFEHEGTLRERHPWTDGTYQDHAIFTLFRRRYSGSPAAQHQVQAFDAVGRPLL